MMKVRDMLMQMELTISGTLSRRMAASFLPWRRKERSLKSKPNFSRRG